jgi:hypothetical protein
VGGGRRRAAPLGTLRYLLGTFAAGILTNRGAGLDAGVSRRERRDGGDEALRRRDDLPPLRKLE